MKYTEVVEKGIKLGALTNFRNSLIVKDGLLTAWFGGFNRDEGTKKEEKARAPRSSLVTLRMRASLQLYRCWVAKW